MTLEPACIEIGNMLCGPECTVYRIAPEEYPDTAGKFFHRARACIPMSGCLAANHVLRLVGYSDSNISCTMSSHLLVLTTFPDGDTARRVARGIVQARLAACVNILPAAQSVYMWQGKECMETEHVALIKTTASGYAALESYVQSHHPYELPELIATPIIMGLETYLDWITENVNT